MDDRTSGRRWCGLHRASARVDGHSTRLVGTSQRPARHAVGLAGERACAPAARRSEANRIGVGVKAESLGGYYHCPGSYRSTGGRLWTRWLGAVRRVEPASV
jgi:hypothetical protein